MAITIHAAASTIWPWLVQMGQGRGGFYTHEWIENLLGANIHNADRIVAAWQQLDAGDRVRLTPDPYLGQPGQVMFVAEIQPKRALVFRQTLPNGSTASWAFLLLPQDNTTTRVIMRRRGGRPTFFDRVMSPGYVLMDREMVDTTLNVYTQVIDGSLQRAADTVGSELFTMFTNRKRPRS